jgi:hypothetical protein
MATKTNIDTKQILNIGLLIGAFLVGKKLLETFGIIKTAQETQQQQQAQSLETSSEQTATSVDTSKPLLSLKPNYDTLLIVKYAKNLGLPNNTTTYKNLRNQFMPLDKTKAKEWPSQLKKVANDIINAKGFFNDDENKLYNAFNQLKNQAQMSYVAYIFEQNKKDLVTFLKSFLNDEELAKVYRIISNKPTL